MGQFPPKNKIILDSYNFLDESQGEPYYLENFITPILRQKENPMAESVYKIIELVGTSTESWEKAASAAIDRAGKTVRDMRIAEISQLDLIINDGKVEGYRTKVKVSFKYEG